MSLFDNLISGVKDKWDSLQKNTFLASFVIAWCLHNWKIIAHLFVINDKNISLQIKEIDTLFHDPCSVYGHPFLFATITTLVYPFGRMLINYLTTIIEFIEKKVSIIQKEGEPLSKEEVVILRGQLRQYEIDKEVLQTKINNQGNEIKKMSNEIYDYLLTHSYPVPHFQYVSRPMGVIPSNLASIDYNILQDADQNIQILYSNIKNSIKRFDDYKKLTKTTRSNNPNNDILSNPSGTSKMYSTELYNDIDITSIDYFESIGLIDKKQIHKFTEKGMEVYKLYINDI